MKNPSRILRILCVLGAVTCGLATHSAFAGNTWTGGGASTNWSDNNNWGGAAPGYGTLTFTTGGAQGTTSNNNSITSMNQLLWTGSLGWTLNGSSTLSLFDNGGTQSKIENQSSGLVTINDAITYAATAGAAFGELNAVNGDITFGGSTLTVNGSQVAGIKLFGSGHTINFNNTVSATGKYFGFTTGGTGNTVNIGGSFTSGDWYVMNGGTLNIASGGSLTTTSVRLGGDFGTTLNQDQTKNGIFQLTSATGGQTFGSAINTVTGNTSGNLQFNSLNTSGTNTVNGGVFLDSQLKISQTTGGTLALNAVDVKAQLLLLLGGGTINLNGVVQSSVTSGANSLQIGSNGLAGGPTVNISNTDTFTGDTLVRAGTLQFATGGSIANSALRLGSTSGTSVDASINLTNATGGQTLVNVINPVATSGSGNLTVNSQNTSNTNTLSGHIGMDRNLTITEAAGAGTLTLSSTHTAADGTNVLGTDIKGNTLTLTPGAGSTINYTGNIYNSTGSGSVIMNGAGTLNLTGGGASTTGNTFSGGLVVKSGTVNASARVDALGGGGAGAVTLGDSAGGSNNASILVSTTGLNFANPFTLASTTTGTLTLGNTGTAISTTFSGGITGTNNLTINENATSGTITLATLSVNNSGTVTNTGAGTGTTTISAAVGSNVTGLTENSTTSAFNVTGGVTVNSGGTTLTNSSGTKLLTLSGGVTGTGNLVINNNSATNGGVTIATAAANNTGTITNSGTGAGNVALSGGVGSNVTGLTESSTTSDFRITGALAVNSGGTTLTNTSGGSQLLILGGVTGTGNLILNNNSSLTSGVSIQSAAANNVGTITNSGTGTGSTSITSSGSVGSNVTGIIENSATSAFNVQGGITVNSSGTTLTNSNASGSQLLTVSGGVTGTGNLTLQNNSAIANGLTLSGTSVNNTGAITNTGTGSGNTQVSAAIGSNVTSVTENSATSGLVLSGQNTYSGPTNLTTGTITLGASSTITGNVLVSGPVGIGTFHIGSGTNADTLQTNVTNTTTRRVANNISLDGDVTFATSTTSGRIALDAFTGLTTPNTIALTRTNQLTLGSTMTVDLLGSMTGSGFGFTELGSGTLNIGGSTAATDNAANTFTGLVTVSGGTLQLNKVAGVNAIAGDGSTGTNDVTVSGGTLKWLNDEQVANTATITVSGGTVDLNGHTETLGSLVVNSGTFQTGANGISPNFNTPTVGLIGITATTNFSGGTSTINTGGSINDGHIIVSGASTVVEVQQGGVMNLQSGGIGLVMNNGTLTLDASNTTAGKLVLNGDVTTVASSGASSIVNGSTGTTSGSIDMMTGTRNFYVNSGSTLTVGAQLTSPGGALNKGSSVTPSNDGLGTLILTGANTYGGGTTVSAGTLLANNTSSVTSATGSGGVMVNSGGTLGGTGFINAGSNNVAIGKDTFMMSTGNGGTITGATNGTVGALTMTATNVIFGGVSGDLGTYLVDLTAGSSDRLAITGNLDLSSAFDQITFQGTTGAASYQLLTYSGSLSGTFDTVSSLPSGYTLSYIPGEIDLVTAVPETSTWVMGALALSTLLVSQRRRFVPSRKAALPTRPSHNCKSASPI